MSLKWSLRLSAAMETFLLLAAGSYLRNLPDLASRCMGTPCYLLYNGAVQSCRPCKFATLGRSQWYLDILFILRFRPNAACPELVVSLAFTTIDVSISQFCPMPIILPGMIDAMISSCATQAGGSSLLISNVLAENDRAELSNG